MEKPEKDEKAPKFKWTRYAKSVIRDMYDRANKAANITQLTPERRREFFDKVATWVLAHKFGQTGAKLIVKTGRKLRKAVGFDQ